MKSIIAVDEINSTSKKFNKIIALGSATIIVMLCGFIKNKFAALILGTAGVGLIASYMSILGLLQTMASLGINTSGVKDIASAMAKNDEHAISRTILTLRRICWITGAIAMLAVFLLSSTIGHFTFGINDHNYEIAWIGVALFVANISAGQMALLQGSGRVEDLAKVNIATSIITAGSSIVLYKILGLNGIIYTLILSACIQLALSYLMIKKLHLPNVSMAWRESFIEATGMIKLGIAMMLCGLINCAVSYLAINLIANNTDLHSVGIYSAAYSISGIVANIVLQAVSTDYYPRLVAVAGDQQLMVGMANEQAKLGLLIAAPANFAVILMAPFIVDILYTQEFQSALVLLNWFVLGYMGRVISWPLGYIMIAKGSAKLVVFTEIFVGGIHGLIMWHTISAYGLEGVGIAFLISCIIHLIVVNIIAVHLTNFKWSKINRNLFVVVGGAGLMMLAVRNGNGIDIYFCFIINLLVALYCLNILIRQ